MAKSIRSKWRRKMRAVKRERYGKKELDRLKKTLDFDATQTTSSDETMKNISEVVTFTTVEEIKDKKKQVEEKDVMDPGEIEEIQKFNPKTLRNENGAYPVWLHPRKIKKCKKAKNKKRKVKSKGKVTKKT